MRGLGKLTRSPYQSAFRSFAIPLLLMILLRASKSAFAEIEIAYDDGLPETTCSLDIGQCVAVKFSLPSGLPSARLVAVRIYKAGRSATDVAVHMLADDGVTEVAKSFKVKLTNDSAWNEAALTAFSVTVPHDFYIAIEYLAYYDPLIGQDTTSSNNRSYCGVPGSWTPIVQGTNVMIRAVVDSEQAHSSTSNARLEQTKIVIRGATYLVAAALATAAVSIVLKRSQSVTSTSRRGLPEA